MIQYTLQTNLDPKQDVHSIALSPDGQFLAAGANDGILLYQLSSGRLFLRVYTLSAVLSLSWDVRGDLYSGCQSGYLALISIDLLLQVRWFINIRILQNLADCLSDCLSGLFTGISIACKIYRCPFYGSLLGNGRKTACNCLYLEASQEAPNELSW